MSLTIGVDVGGTKVAGGVVDDHGRIIEKLRRATPAASPERTAAVIADVVSRAARPSPGRARSGWARPDSWTRQAAPWRSRRTWPGATSRCASRSRTWSGCRSLVENDANASAWAELRFGAARGQQHVVLISVGTGIGAGLVLDGRLYRGRWGMAGEPGHYRVVPDGRLCGCGNRGCWEQYASGSALVTEARDFAVRTPGGAVRLLQLGWRGARRHRRASRSPRPRARAIPAALRCFDDRGQLARPGPGRPGRDPRPGLLRDRRRRVTRQASCCSARRGPRSRRRSPERATGRRRRSGRAALGVDAGHRRCRGPGPQDG